ncbi:sodium-coupled monocarboxylate transporter 2-like isoform X2 [Argopecten irradians]|uniref:sodium-coupled monocarboxylate transporter 2-like isoform X2 n=1 Tax=Argopecten irradians TaxID=31199 RepID=UPI0037109C48
MDPSSIYIPHPHVADYIVIASFLCICTGIGIYNGHQTNKNPTLENYLLGNRRLLLLPVSMSLFVTFMSAISLMGIPAEVYAYGIIGILVFVANIFSVLIASNTIVPLLFPLKVTSAYEYLQLRFRSKGVRTFGTIIGMLQTLAYMGVSLYAPGLALQIVAGIPLWLSVVLIGLVGTLYTAIGTVLMEPRHSIIEIAKEGRRLEITNFDLDPRTRHSVWGICIGLTFSLLPNYCNQASVQRLSSLRSLNAAKRAFWLLCPFLTCYYVVLGYLGILLYAYYNTLECDPVQAGFLTNFNQLMPFFVLDVLRSLPGLSGVYISCLFSGALSTLSSGINSLAANTVEDIIGNCLKESKIISQTTLAKLCVYVFGFVVIGLAYAINSMSGTITQMGLSIFGACGGPLAGLFFLGGMVPKANSKGAVFGALAALVFNVWMAVGSQMYGSRPRALTPNPMTGCFSDNITDTMNISSLYFLNTTEYASRYDVSGNLSVPVNNITTPEEGFYLYNVSYVWYGLIGFTLTLIIGTLVSLLTGSNGGSKVDPCLIFPIFRKMYGLESSCKYNKTDTDDNNSTGYPEA